MGISDSRFNMWRAVAAMMHADEIVQPHEVNFILESTKDLELSFAQRQTLIGDLEVAGDMEAFYKNITAPRDKEDFFHLARAIAWSDGEMDAREQALLQKVRTMSAAFKDVAIMDTAISNFRGIYIEGGAANEDRDQPVYVLIHRLLKLKAAA